MRYQELPGTGLQVSRCCLGTMTWGSQNTEEEGFAQMDLAVERGVNFFDTAELYPVPPREEWWARTEEIIGRWFKARTGMREKIVLATKMAGPAADQTWREAGSGRFTAPKLKEALDGSCRRLGTDVIDLYQLHWPERRVNIFGRLGWTAPASGEEDEATPLAEALAALEDLRKAGRIRAFGVSNETPWGMMELLRLAEKTGAGRIASVQNPYSLLNRSFEVGLAEVAWREGAGLLAYAPLAAGVLSGKYLDGKRPEGARFTLFPQSSRYFAPSGEAAVKAYAGLAAEHGLEPATLAHAFVYSRPFLLASIIGATNLEQLKTAIAAEEVELSEEVLSALEELHHAHTYPCP